MSPAVGRKPISVTRDDDGGLTIRDHTTGIVLSVIASHPHSNDPSLHIEAYAANGDIVLATDVRPEHGIGSHRPQYLLRTVPRA